jgi:hypothetical protein
MDSKQMAKSLQVLFKCASCLFAVALTACLWQKPTRLDIIGLWVEEYEGVARTVPENKASLDFFANNRFEAHNIPQQYFIDAGLNPERIDVSGSWQLDTSSNDPFQPYEVMLKIDPFRGYPYGLERHLSLWRDASGLFASEGGDNIYINFVKERK